MFAYRLRRDPLKEEQERQEIALVADLINGKKIEIHPALLDLIRSYLPQWKYWKESNIPSEKKAGF